MLSTIDRIFWEAALAGLENQKRALDARIATLRGDLQSLNHLSQVLAELEPGLESVAPAAAAPKRRGRPPASTKIALAPPLPQRKVRGPMSAATRRKMRIAQRRRWARARAA